MQKRLRGRQRPVKLCIGRRLGGFNLLRIVGANTLKFLRRGSLHLLLGNPHEAAAAYREALALEPRPEVHLNLARALLASGDVEAARRHFALAVRLDPALASQVPAAGR